jgi:redox-sensing transcriptional repressor
MNKGSSARKLPTSGIYRLALYNRYLSGINKDDGDYISSQELADATGHTAAQVRKDLTWHGGLGEAGKGYEIGKLKAMLTKSFGKDKVRNVILICVGNLGRALISYSGFPLQKFRIAAAFDRDMRKIGTCVDNTLIRDIRELDATIANLDVEIAIVAVPKLSLQRVVDRLVAAGIKAILNFAPGLANVPEGIELHNVDLSVELDRFCYLLETKS